MIRKISSSLKGDGYQARAFRSTGLVLLNFGGENILRLASNLVLTRLLFPEAFGLMSLVQVVVAGAAMFSDLGFRSAVVQSPRGDDPDFLNTVWTLQVLRGLLLAGIVLVLAGPAARFYEEPVLADLLMIAAIVPFIGSLESTRSLTADRTLQIERLTLITLGSNLVGSLVTILLAWWDGTVLALAIGLLVAPCLKTALSHAVLKGHPNRPRLERASAFSLFTYGGFIFIASMAGFFASHGDRAVLGKYVTLDNLAIYNIAMLLAQVPRQLCNAVESRVIFPLYARRPPAESDMNRRKINKARYLVTAPLLIMACFLGSIGDGLVRLMYDPRYEAAGPFLVLLSLAVVPPIIVQSYSKLPLASGHSAKFAFLQIAIAAVRFGLLILLVPTYGLLGAVGTIPLTTFAIYPLMVYLFLPYRAWDPVHDTLAFLCWIAICAWVIWFNFDVLQPLFGG